MNKNTIAIGLAQPKAADFHLGQKKQSPPLRREPPVNWRGIVFKTFWDGFHTVGRLLQPCQESCSIAAGPKYHKSTALPE